jgi:hypothetical protein
MAKRLGAIRYNRQPPSTVQPAWGAGITRGLLYASAIPYELARSRASGAIKPTVPTASAPTFGAMLGLGKTLVFDTASTQGEDYAGATTPNPPFTIMVEFRQNSQPSVANIITAGGDGAGRGWSLWTRSGTNDLVFTFGFINDYPLGLTVATGVTYTAVITVSGNGGTVTGYLIRKDTNSIQYGSGVLLDTMATPASKPITLGVSHNGTAYGFGFDGHIGAWALWDRCLSVAEAVSLLANPYQLWSIPGRMQANAAAAAALEASAAAVATATADLTTAITMAASPQAVATAIADLTTAITMRAASPSAIATATADLTTTIALAASAAAAAGTSADLTTAIALAASPSAVATGTADLTTAIALVAAAQAVASGTADLTTAIALVAAATGQSLAQAALTTQIALAASPQAVATALADLTTQIALMANAQAVASASADLELAGASGQFCQPVHFRHQGTR